MGGRLERSDKEVRDGTAIGELERLARSSMESLETRMAELGVRVRTETEQVYRLSLSVLQDAVTVDSKRLREHGFGTSETRLDPS